MAADAGNPKRNTRWPPSTRKARRREGFQKAVRLLQAASLADNVDAEVEYAIALYNGTGTPKNEVAAVALLRKAQAEQPIAQNRLARVLTSGPGTPSGQGRGVEMAPDRQDAGKGDPSWTRRFAGLSADDRARPKRPRAAGSARPDDPLAKNDPLDAGASAGHPSLRPYSSLAHFRREPKLEPMLHSASSMSWSRPRAAPDAASSATWARSSICRCR